MAYSSLPIPLSLSVAVSLSAYISFLFLFLTLSLSLSLCLSHPLSLCPYSRVIRTCLGHSSSLCSQGFWINISFHRCYRFYGRQRSSDWPNRWVEVEQNREGYDNMFYSNDFWGVRNENEMKNDRMTEICWKITTMSLFPLSLFSISSFYLWCLTLFWVPDTQFSNPLIVSLS